MLFLDELTDFRRDAVESLPSRWRTAASSSPARSVPWSSRTWKAWAPRGGGDYDPIHGLAGGGGLPRGARPRRTADPSASRAGPPETRADAIGRLEILAPGSDREELLILLEEKQWARQWFIERLRAES